MNIKIQCSCGTKFSFDVEPVDGKMPVSIACPKCGADTTAAANAQIEQNLSCTSAGTASSTEPVARPRMRLQVTGHAAAAATPSQAAMETTDAAAVAEKCPRHPKNFAVERCVVCQKPICPECMQSFGYLCSIACRYQAEREKIPVPVYKLQKSAVEKKAFRKNLAITLGVLAVLALFLGAWIWYITVGDKPRPFYSLKVPDTHGLDARFLGPTQVLLLSQKQARLHDLKSKKDVWSTALEDPKPTENTGSSTNSPASDSAETSSEDFDPFASLPSRPEPIFRDNAVWVCLTHNLVGLDLKSGEIKQTVPFKGRLSAFTPGESTLLVVCAGGQNKEIVTQIDLNSGAVKTEEVASSLREKVNVSKDLPDTVLPTAAFLLKHELEAEDENTSSIYKFSSEFFPAGQNLVEMQVKLVEPKIETVQSMKPAGPSHINENTTASTSSGLVAEEIFNDMKRSRTGGYKRFDVSHYNVLLRRSLEKNAPDWSGEVSGLPVFFPQKTVDVLVAGKTVIVFDKQNKKLFEAQLSYFISDAFTDGLDHEGRAPCVEKDGTLYLFDQGVLTAFSLPDGAVRWRLPSVGIREIQFDDKGMLYLSTTTGAPEDIQYSDQIKMNDAPLPIIVKVDPKSGKLLWKCNQTGAGLFLTGKYVYMTDVLRVGFSIVNATEEAFGTPSRAPGVFRIVRIDPANGKRLWAFLKKGRPENIDFSQNRILLQYGSEIQFLKYIAF